MLYSVCKPPPEENDRMSHPLKQSVTGRIRREAQLADLFVSFTSFQGYVS